MQARQSALAASLLLGVLWGLWHLPLLIARGLPLTSAGLVGLIGYVLMIPLPFAVLFTWVYNNTKGSLFLMVLFHTVIDFVGVSIIYYPSNIWIFNVLYIILNWVVVTIVVVMARAARLSRSSTLAPA
jgi:CAAX protease family protein